MSNPAGTPLQPPGGDEFEAQAAAVLEATRSLIGEKDSDRILDRLGHLFRSHLSGCAVEFWLREGASSEFRPAGSAAAAPDQEGLTSAHGFVRRVAAEGETVLLAAARSDSLTEEDDGLTTPGVAFLLGAPLVIEGEPPLGVVLLLGREPREFSPQQLALLRALASTAAAAIRSARLRDEQVRRTANAEWLAELARAVSSARSAKRAFSEVCQRAALLCGAERGSIYLWDDTAARVVPAVSQYATGRPDEVEAGRFREMRGRLLEKNGGLITQMVETRRPVLIADARQSPLIDPVYVEWFQPRSLLGVPLLVDDKPVGALLLDRKEVRPFTAAEVDLARGVSDQVVFAIEKTLLVEETEERLRQTEAQLEISRTLNSTLELKPLLMNVARQAARACGMDRCSIYLWDEERVVPVMSQYADGRADPALWHDFKNLGRMRLDELPFFAETVRRRGPIVIDHPETDPLVPRTLDVFRLTALLAVPLVRQEKVVGAIALDNTVRRRAVTPAQVTLATTIASQVALAVDNARLHDETRRRLLESRRLYDQAQGALAELKAAQERLVQSEKSRAVAEIAGGVAHDFNNLLAAVLGRTQYLLHGLDRGAMEPAEARRNLAIIERSAVDGAETVKRLLDFTRTTPSAGEADVVDVRALLAQTVDVSRYRWKDGAEAMGQQIAVLVEPGEAPPVVGNAAELRGVLLNLVLNAIDAMPEGGTLTLSSRAEGDRVSVSVRDTGTGISEEVKGRIFDPFFTTKGPQSSGLGLSASQGIVRSYGGEITVESAPGQGTTFTVSLKAVPAEAQAPVGRAEVPPASEREGKTGGRALRILVIDDDEEVRTVLRDLLADVGHQVWEAEAGDEGLALLDAQPVDLVITDLGMPGMSGWEVADRVKARWPERKLALVTGWGAQIKPEQLKAHGVDFLLAKPFALEDLLGLIDSANG